MGGHPAKQFRLPLRLSKTPAARAKTIIAALRQKPMTSGEVIAATGLSKSQVYSMLNILRNEGLVKSVRVEGIMFPVQHLTEKK